MLLNMTGQYRLTGGDLPDPDPDPEDLLEVSDNRVIAWADPNYSFSTSPSIGGVVALTQISPTWDPSKNFRQISEPGIIGTGSDYAFSRINNPADSGRKVYLHTIDNDFPLYSGDTSRSEFLHGGYLNEAQEYWVGFGYYFTSNCYVSGNMCGLGDIHHNNWSNGPYGRPSRANQTPVSFYMSGDGNANLSGTIRGCYVDDFQINDITSTSFMSGFNTTVNTWYYFVINIRLGRNWGDSPFVRIWRKPENSSVTKLIDRNDIPIGYRDVPANQNYCKYGLYDWRTNPNSPTVTRRTIYSKGMQVFTAGAGTPTLDEFSMFALLENL